VERLPPSVRFLTAVALLGLLLAGGTFGYSRIEGWEARDSFYMTVITITTTGFGEVRPLSPQGRSFTVVLLAFSLLTLGYAVTALIGFIFEGQMLASLRERRMKRNLRLIKSHYIICGGGNVGRAVALEFQRERVRFLVIERSLEHSELARDPRVLCLEGDATDDELLMQAGIQRARGLVSALPEDEANVFVVLTARQLNPGLIIAAQASDERTVRKLVKAGADRVISHKQIAGRRLASLILHPTLVNFLDEMLGGGELGMRIEEVPVAAGSPLIGQAVREAGIGRRTGAILVGILNPDGRLRVNPSGGTTLSGVKLSSGDVLVALGSEEQLKRLREFTARTR
jgi:voltage-gated potassium channel